MSEVCVPFSLNALWLPPVFPILQREQNVTSHNNECRLFIISIHSFCCTYVIRANKSFHMIGLMMVLLFCTNLITCILKFIILLLSYFHAFFLFFTVSGFVSISLNNWKCTSRNGTLLIRKKAVCVQCWKICARNCDILCTLSTWTRPSSWIEPSCWPSSKVRTVGADL